MKFFGFGGKTEKVKNVLIGKKGNCGHYSTQYATCSNGHISCRKCYELSKTVCTYCRKEERA